MKPRQPPIRDEAPQRTQERPVNPHVAEVRKTIHKARELRAESQRLIARKARR